MNEALDRLARFAAEAGFLKTRGALNVGLILTRRARDDGLPLYPEAQLAESGGQVRGLSGRAGDRILQDHGVTRSIGTEVGRTNRGSIDKMRTYVAFLNALAAVDGFDLAEVERFWVDQFIARFASQPFRVRRDPGMSVQQTIGDLIAQADERQREMGGAMVTGAVLQHLVGAKLDVALEGRAVVTHHGANANDVSGRGGDFDIGDAVIHVSTAPGELLIAKCRANVEQGLRPMIVTTAAGASAARLFARQRGDGLEGRVEVFEVEQFVSVNVAELGLFDARRSTETLRRIVERYNTLIDAHETDPSLAIRWS